MINISEKVEKGINTMKEVSLTVLAKKDMKDVTDALDVLKEKMDSYIKEHPEKENVVETYDPDDSGNVKSVGLDIEDAYIWAYIKADNFEVSFLKKNKEYCIIGGK